MVFTAFSRGFRTARKRRIMRAVGLKTTYFIEQNQVWHNCGQLSFSEQSTFGRVVFVPRPGDVEPSSNA